MTMGLSAAKITKPLTLDKIHARSSQTGVKLCLEMSEYLSDYDTSQMKPYITIRPDTPFGIRVSYDDICLTKLKPRTEYTVRVDRRIPLGDERIDRDYTLTKSTVDIDPGIRAKGDGYLLPAKGEITLPIETTNIDKVAVYLYRINTRNLIRSINRYNLLRTMPHYQLRKVAREEGYRLWRKTLTIDAKPNTPKITAIPVGTQLKQHEPGIYILDVAQVMADGEEDTFDEAMQWFMISDIGLFSTQGSDGLRIEARRLSDAQPYPNVRFELIAANNEKLATAMSRDGHVRFSANLLGGKRGLTPRAVYAYGENGDFSVLDLSRAPHNLTDRGVSGRTSLGRYNALIYSNRGIFRPGERFPFRALVRDAQAQAIGGLKLSAKLIDARQEKVGTTLLESDTSGYLSGSFPIAESANTGTWRLELYAGQSQPFATLPFLVEDFVPPKVTLKVTRQPRVVLPDTETEIEAQARYLTGEPLTKTEGSMTVVLHQASEPFPLYRDYHFGDISETFDKYILNTESFETDANGTVRITLEPENIPNSSLPLALHIALSISEPGGRAVETYLEPFFEDKSGYIGIKPLFKNRSIDLNSPVRFDLVYLQHSKPVSAALRYRLIREEVEWNWSKSDDGGGWEYYRTYRDQEEVTNGAISLGARPAPFTLKALPWGSYRLEIRDTNGILSSYRFSSGYEESISRASPDRLPVAVDKQVYHPGETIRVNITPKFSGPVTVSVAHHRILTTQTAQAKAGQPLEMAFAIDPEWGGSAYILATAFRAQSAHLGADRAIGVAHIAIEDPAKRITLGLEAPKRIHAKSQLTVHLQAHAKSSKPIYVTLAAVDEGVLGLTRYQAPDPIDFFFGQRKLGVKIRDLYGDLIKTMGAHAQFDVGAGDDDEEVSLKERATTSKRKVVAFLSQRVVCDANGTATVRFDLPDYQGALRLMAVAWNGDALGSAQGNVIVKDPVSAEIYLPGFLSTGDQAEALVRIAIDAEVPAGQYTVNFHAKGGVTIKPEHHTITHDGSASHAHRIPVTLEATAQQDGNITLAITHEGRSVVRREWGIGVRAPYPQSYVRTAGLLSRHKTIAYDALVDPTQWSAVHDIRLRLSGMPLLSSESYRQELIDYPSRCAEQTSSRAFPWLDRPKAKQKGERVTLIERAIERLGTLQRISGGFGLWSESTMDLWVSAYAMDLLTRARERGYVIPARNIDQGLRWLERNIDRWSKDQSTQAKNAYALYVLARNGRTLISPMRTLSQSTLNLPGALGHLAAAFAHVGETQKAKTLFTRARHALGNRGSTGGYDNFGGSLRDQALLVSLLVESGLQSDAIPLYADLARAAKKRRWLSTQELATLLRADEAVGMERTPLRLRVGASDLSPDSRWQIRAKSLAQLPDITNLGNDPIWYDISYIATPVPEFYSARSNHGFAIEKRLFTLEGDPVDPTQIAQKSRLIVVLSGRIENNQIHHPMITDWLPAGFELENPHISGSDITESLSWIGTQNVILHAAYRTDRFEVAFEPRESNNTFTVAYAARAVTRGSYTLPPTRIVDMYRPYYRAFGSVSRDRLLIKDPATVTPPTKQNDVNATAAAPAQLSDQDYRAAFSRKVGDLSRHTITQLNFLRNGIFAQAGLDFSRTNPMLDQRFKPFDWYQSRTQNSGAVYARLSPIQKQNVQKLLAEEKRRGGGLSLSDFFRVKTRALTQQDLAKYDKKSLRILRNSLIARYGYRLKDPELDRIYRSMPWYHPTDITASEVLDQKMNALERANVQQILTAEHAR
jgi:uncharacterized protein YfaS (alpha-2-macroglobulin family)